MTIMQTRGAKRYPRIPTPQERKTEVRKVIEPMEVPSMTPDIPWRFEDIPDAVNVSTDASSSATTPISKKDFPPDFKFANIPNVVYAPRQRYYNLWRKRRSDELNIELNAERAQRRKR